MKKNSGLIQFIKFGLVGVSNTAIDWLAFFVLVNTLILTKEGEPFAKAIAFIIAVINSYVWNTIWTFRQEYKESIRGGDKTRKNVSIFLRFVIVSLIGWGVNYLAFKYTRFDLSQGQVVALIAASGAATLWNFFANKFWTYKK